jgi:tRNA uridine 5-carboxymethylaminomethyl modification enzyme
MFEEYDIIVAGAGHAGCEAAAIAGKMGSKVLLISPNMMAFAQMSCNPAMGGVAKGQVIRELDAMGACSGIVADQSAIQFRMLNKSKGPAMWSPRTQNDRSLFSIVWRRMLENNKNVDFWQDMVAGLIIENKRAVGIISEQGKKIRAKAIILANGTFLNGIIHIGEKQMKGGRIGENPSAGLTEQLKEKGIEYGRMKTGTPVRVDGRTVDFSKMEEQKGDEKPGKFSFAKESKALTKQRSCYIAYTNEEVHNILRKGFAQSPLFNDRIKGVGPRYCPSIEDKIERFADRTRHQLFIEPEGWDTVELYINGFSSSLPDYIQWEALRKIPGFEKARIFRPGYAIEYDYFPPTQLNNTLESKIIENLYFAGQINGTTGYEEAAAQGHIAGINAHLKMHDEEPFVLLRSEAYTGVLIDDLVTKGTEEPYRLFTSRAEYRILLRQDNADIRLWKKAAKLKLISEDRIDRVKEKLQGIEEIKTFLKSENSSLEDLNRVLLKSASKAVKQKKKLHTLLLRPEIKLLDLQENIEKLGKFLQKYDEEIIEEAEIQIKYESYIEKEKEIALKFKKLESIEIPASFNYSSIRALSSEAIEKLRQIQPATIGQASRISGVSPADISVLLIYLKRKM